jgi:hypothetical protein
MNEKGHILSIIIAIIILIIVLVIVVFATKHIIKDMKDYQRYKSFCNERPNFCYCSWEECEFKTMSFSSTGFTNGIQTSNSSGMSEDTIELCKLAKELNDKKMEFRIGCN